MRKFTFCWALLGMALAVGSGFAADYPTKPITIVVPYGAGAADFSARNLAAVVPNYLGQAVMVVNKSGAGGITGSVSVLSAKPDGYTLLLGRIGSQAITPALQPNIPYKWNDFTMLGLLDLDPFVCIVKADSEYKTLEDLITAIKKRPGQLKYSTAGPATSQALAPQMLFDLTGISNDAAVAVPFKGGSEAGTALLGGHVDFNCNPLAAVIGNIKAGTARALFVTTPERLPNLPNVPTVAELGLKEMEDISGWSAIYGPPNMDPKAVSVWKEALQKIKKDETWRQMVAQVGSIPQMLSQEETFKFVEHQVSIYRALGKKVGITEE